MKTNDSHSGGSSSRSAYPMVRVFCSIELPVAIRTSAIDHISQLRLAVPDARASWEKDHKLHVTLKFLGEISEDKVAMITKAAGEASSGIPPLLLKLNGAGAFHSRGLPKVLWLGIEDPSGKLSQLHSNLESAYEAIGFNREIRPFHPHLTIARIRSSNGARDLANAHRAIGFEPQDFVVSELLVMRSELGPGGSLYTAISRHPFTD